MGPPAIALIPLDARPCTRGFPVCIGRTGGLEVVVPPPDLLGDLTRPAPVDDLFRWLEGVAPDVDGAILGLDTLVYGGLIPARRSPESYDVLAARLARVQSLPIATLYAFGVTMRVSNSDAAEEEKAYWAEYGPAIHRWSYHADRFDVTGEPEARAEAARARAGIPDAIAEDYLETRRRNHAINMLELDLARSGLFEILCLTQDDCSPFGFNQAEKRALEAQGVRNVLIYPGADEVASTLVGRYLNRQAGRVPVFRLRPHPPEGADLVALYEDRPLRATAAGQIRAVGGRLLDDGDPGEGDAGPGAEADVELLLNAPAGGQGDLCLRLNLERVDQPPRDLSPLIARLRGDRPMESGFRIPVALADVAYANGADPRLWKELAGRFDPSGVAAFGAWNTAGNTLGTVVAAASAYLTGPADPAAHRAFILDRLADDYLYQAVLRPALQREGRPAAEAERELGERLERLWRERFPHLPIRAIRASFPWRRYFEVDVRVEEA